MSSWQESYGYTPLHGGFTSGTRNGNLVIEGLDETLNKIGELSLSNPDMENAVKKVIKAMLLKVARKTRQDASNVVGSGYKNSNGDPRQAYLAVKSMVYKRILGGNVSILAKHKRSGKIGSLPTEGRKQVTDKNGQHRGGNRRPRTQRTTDLMTYWGADRGFVLRFLNAGTKTRNIRTGNNSSVNKRVGRGHTSASLQSLRNGNRGSIGARNWFRSSSMANMEDYMEELSKDLEKVISEVWKGSTVASAANVNFD